MNTNVLVTTFRKNTSTLIAVLHGFIITIALMVAIMVIAKNVMIQMAEKIITQKDTLL